MQIGTSQRPAFVKRYARRVHRPAIGAHPARQNLMTMATVGDEFVVIDAQSGEGATRSQRLIIVEH
jgi:polyhydroxyalkanoate synthesis regulator protein